MAVEALAALGTAHLFDRRGSRVLLAVPVLVAAVPLSVFASQLWPVLAGIVLWGVATGIQVPTVKAFVADLVPASRRVVPPSRESSPPYKDSVRSPGDGSPARSSPVTSRSSQPSSAGSRRSRSRSLCASRGARPGP
jgi:hypothetical protein